MSQLRARRIAFVGNYLPRQCGIATFTTDLCEAVAREAKGSQCLAVAMNDTPNGYGYPETVRFEIPVNERDRYDLAADFLNLAEVDVICVQHEYGIFGGPAGRHVLPLLRQVRAPVVTTLHTVLDAPSHDERRSMEGLAEVSDRLVVMSPKAESFLREVHGVPEDRVEMIHHGIPDVSFVDPNYYKDKFNAEGRRVLLTFGLLSPGKGIEYALEALPTIIARHPDVLYIVLGATHPHVKRHRGEEYRISLQKHVRELGLEKHVAFKNQFVELRELCEYLGAADIYITPYLSESQIVSGTLAYALGTGKAVVSTPYWYATDMLAEDRGRIVPFRDAGAIAEQVLDLLDHEAERHAMRKRAYQLGREMVWREVARRYVHTFERVLAERANSPRPVSVVESRRNRVQSLPAMNPRHLYALTDDVGIIQHAKFTVPDREHGYSTDDQARALMVAVLAASRFPDVADWELLQGVYLSYLLYAFDRTTKRFSNFMDYGRSWSKQVATEDVHARALWALAHVVAHGADAGKRSLATQLLADAMPSAMGFSSPRAQAFAVLAIETYLKQYPGASAFLRERRHLAYSLYQLQRSNATAEWPWLEDSLTYANARIPHALIAAGQSLGDAEMMSDGIAALKWLDRLQAGDDGQFVPIGSDGWYPRDGKRARFDQQPIEAFTMLDACVAGYRATEDKGWLKIAQRSFDWFLGRNDLREPLYDYGTGGCRDGLRPDGVNQNQGAESTVVWLLSLILMHDLRDEKNGSAAKAGEQVQRADAPDAESVPTAVSTEEGAGQEQLENADLRVSSSG